MELPKRKWRGLAREESLPWKMRVRGERGETAPGGLEPPTGTGDKHLAELYVMPRGMVTWLYFTMETSRIQIQDELSLLGNRN